MILEDASIADPGIGKRHMPDHLAFLDKHLVEAAGPLSDGERKGRDRLWIIDAPNRETVEAMIRETSFRPAGLRASYAVLD
ncbi:MAG: hypothetical protein AAGC96_03380 [Pseudomonadota bacterium]